MLKQKCFCAFAVLCVAVAVLSGCEGGQTSAGKEELCADFEPASFSTLEEFEAAIQTAEPGEEDRYDLAEIGAYYLPTAFTSLGTLDSIDVRENYVILEYRLELLEDQAFADVEEEERAYLANTILFRWSRYEDGATLLHNTVEQQDLMEYTQDVYYQDITFPMDTGDVLARIYYWLSDGYMFRLQLPIGLCAAPAEDGPVDTSFTQVERVALK